MASCSQDIPYTCTLNAEMLEKAKKELNEDPATRLLEIKTLRERLEKVPGLKFRKDDAFLLRFLRSRKFDQERAFTQVLTYYRIRKEHPEVFDNLTPNRIRNILQSGVMGVLKDRAPDGSCVLVFRPGSWDPDQNPIHDVFGNNFLTLSKLIEDEETQVCGFTMLADMSGISWNQAKHISPSSAKIISTLIQEAFPSRFKGIHYVHEPTFFDVMFAIIKQFMKEKILKRIHVHGKKLESLHQYLPPEILPQEFGGRLPPYSTKEWMETMLACEAQFAEDNKYGFLDMIIPANEQKKVDATESLAGTFRKLNVD